MIKITDQQFSDMEFLRELMEASRPAAVLAVDIGERLLSTVSDCVRELHVDCQIESLGFAQLPCFMDRFEGEIDFLILNAACNMPMEVLNFLTVFPKLKQNAVVVLQDMVLQKPGESLSFASSILWQSVTADMLPHNRQYYPDIRERMKLCEHTSAYPQYSHIYRSSHFQFEILSGFRINKNTRAYLGDLFSVLYMPWPYIPDQEYLQGFEALIEKRYNSQYLRLYREARSATDYSFDLVSALWDMIGTLSFSHILLYGAGYQGHIFLNLAKEASLQIDGFVVSDGQVKEKTFEGLPVYSYSQVPFGKDETLIVHTTDSKEIEAVLQKSPYHWIRLPNSFWRRMV